MGARRVFFRGGVIFPPKVDDLIYSRHPQNTVAPNAKHLTTFLGRQVT